MAECNLELRVKIKDRHIAEIMAERNKFANALTEIANYATSDEGDGARTEEFFGLSVDEVVAAAHDDMILIARRALWDK